MLKNMKIGKRLVVSFICVILVYLVSAVASFISLSNVSHLMDEFYDKSHAKTNLVGDMLYEIRSGERSLLWAITTTDASAVESRLNDMSRSFDALFTNLEQLNVISADNSEQQNLLNQLSNLVKPAATIRTQIMEAASRNDNITALALYDSQYEPIMEQAQEILQQFSGTARNNATNFYRESKVAYQIALGVMVALTAAIIIIMILLCLALTRSLVRPITEIEYAAKEISKGNLQVSIGYQGRDEMGQLADSMRTTIQVLGGMIEDVAYCLSELAKGNFTVRSKDRSLYRGELYRMIESMIQIKSRMNDTMTRINQAADQVASGAEQVSTGAQALSQGATEQASSVEELAATMSTISGQVQESAKNARLASNTAAQVGTDMQQSNEKMNDMIAAMKEITETSSEISKIIKTIEDIAFQTNILALNAAVEAARAGAAGKGFAVVADEVRNLASKSAEASKNTAALIERSVTAVNRGSQIVDDTAQALVRAVECTEEAVGLIDQVADAANQQSDSINQITQGIDQIASVVQTNSATAEESAAASEELSSQAQIVRGLVSSFQLDGGASSAEQQYASASVSSASFDTDDNKY